MRPTAGWGRLVLAAACLVAMLLVARVAAAEPLRVVSFNMLHGGLTSEVNGDAERLEDRLRLAVADLEVLDADVIGLQEASVGSDRGDVATRLAAALGMPFVLEASPRSWFDRLTATVLRLSEGPALASRHPLLATSIWPLPRCGDSSSRSLVCAEVATPGGAVTVCSTHVDGGECQLAALSARVRSRCPTTPLVLTGDLNATETHPGVESLLTETGLRDTFRDANPDAAGPTVWQPVETERPTVRRRVDVVLAAPGGGLGFAVLASRVVLDRPHATPAGPLWPSDHRAVLSELELVAAPSPPSPPACVRLGGS
jgi:endonuclease/exonuclease/phosphatase family metal-dependent hydrolase